MGQKGEDYNIWLEGLDRQTYARVSSNLSVEVVVVGGGITGVLTAHSLAKAGKKVALVDKGRLGEWTTDCTTAFLTGLIDTSYSSLSWIYGQDKAKLIWDSHIKAIDNIESLIKDNNIKCDFERVSLRVIAQSKRDKRRTERESRVLTKLEIDNSWDRVSGNLELKNQASYQPMAFLAGLADKATELGVFIFEQSEIVSVKKDGAQWELMTDLGYKLKAQAVVLATYSPWGEPWHLYFKKAMYRSYALELITEQNTADWWGEGLYVDMASPYHYFRIKKVGDKKQIIFGGADHRADVPVSRNKSYNILLADSKKLFGESLSLKRRWSGNILESIDGLPYIGQDKRTGLYHAFAFSGNGLTYASLASMITTEQICSLGGKDNKWAQLYRVNRLPNWRAMFIKGIDYASVLLGGAVRSWLSYL